jgi:hypothetical protein
MRSTAKRLKSSPLPQRGFEQARWRCGSRSCSAYWAQGAAHIVVYATIILCAPSFASAIFFVLDFDKPLSGPIRISSEPARDALRHLDAP